MSLITVVSDPTVQKRFEIEFSKPRLSKRKILAEPITKNYSTVGTAFDYLLRFYVKRLNPSAIDVDYWVAEIVQVRIEDDYEDQEMADFAGLILSSAREEYNAFLKEGIFTDQLLRSTLLLAKLDAVYRFIDVDEWWDFYREEWYHIDERDILDLKNLINIVNPEQFKAKKACYLNPSFGYGSYIVGGGDADLIIDNMLIDIKTTKTHTLMKPYYYQLIGYVILDEIDGKRIKQWYNKSSRRKSLQIDKDEYSRNRPYSKIEKIGIYFARFGHLITIDLKDVYKNAVNYTSDKKQISSNELNTVSEWEFDPELLKWFESQAKKYNH